jgi:hypothetical protein
MIIEWARNPSYSIGFRAESAIIGGVPHDDRQERCESDILML